MYFVLWNVCRGHLIDAKQRPFLLPFLTDDHLAKANKDAKDNFHTTDSRNADKQCPGLNFNTKKLNAARRNDAFTCTNTAHRRVAYDRQSRPPQEFERLTAESVNWLFKHMARRKREKETVKLRRQVRSFDGPSAGSNAQMGKDHLPTRQFSAGTETTLIKRNFPRNIIKISNQVGAKLRASLLRR
ncbi:hypothetical protein BJ508DRAFT_308408 [Ascobolus immersus RN42]|uniref:Uncharacterized protein n=1 Tax=Ascobolus immersus RN42 TaxID=1160509 RepID=A0A3N4HZM1_ASCIM|nr:hypothetical protein BJ508DRAFT_308408 [Ascobolus immersus RN42]